jgi:transcription antitermination factor NusG
MSSVIMNSDKKWYVLQTRPRNEDIVYRQIKLKGIEAFLPQVEKIRIWSDRKKKIYLPLFPGYIFVHANEEERFKAISNTAGAIRYVFFEGRPAVIKDREIKLIEDSIKEPEKITLDEKRIGKGDDIIVTHGIFKGMKGKVNEFRGNYKLTVNLEELSYSFSIILSSGEVELLTNESVPVI